MTPADFVNYAISKGCKHEPVDSRNYYHLVNPNKQKAECYVYSWHKVLYFENAQGYCVDLQIGIITEKEYDTY
jgi:hypothetical protein